MIDFRYHLISLIAVFLALGLGILMGSVVLDEQLVERLRNRVDDLAQELDEQRRITTELRDRSEADQAFAVAAADWILRRRLRGESVVVFEADGTRGEVADGITDAVERAGGTVASTISLSGKFALRSQVERDELAVILGSPASATGELRAEAGAELGRRVAAAAASTPDRGGVSGARARLDDLLTELQQAEFVGVDRVNEAAAVPPAALFVVLAGDEDRAPFAVGNLVGALATAVAERGAPVVVAEPSQSTWGVVADIRDDGETRNVVTTVDQAETIAGQIAVVLGAELTDAGVVDHYGAGRGATAVIPLPGRV